MEVIHEIIKESVSGSFWKFCGYFLMIGLIVVVPLKVLVLLVFGIFKKDALNSEDDA